MDVEIALEVASKRQIGRTHCRVRAGEGGGTERQVLTQRSNRIVPNRTLDRFQEQVTGFEHLAEEKNFGDPKQVGGDAQPAAERSGRFVQRVQCQLVARPGACNHGVDGNVVLVDREIRALPDALNRAAPLAAPTWLLLAGRAYREYLRPGLGERVVTPLAGLGSGQQLAWLQAQNRAAPGR